MFLGLMFLRILAFGQPGNMVYIRWFLGLSVGAEPMVTMATCNTIPFIPCILVIASSLAVFSQGALPQLCSNCYLQDVRVAGNQQATQIAGVWQADQWCSTPGLFDQSCVQNAIDNIGVDGRRGIANRHMEVHVIPAGQYTWNATVTVPALTQVEIRGAGLESNWGTELVASRTFNESFFQIDADSVTLDGLFIHGNNRGDCFTLGTSSNPVYDTRIFNDWLQGCGTAIHLVNYSGGHFYANDIEEGTRPISGDATLGDKQASDLLIENNRIYNNALGIVLNGSGDTPTGSSPLFGVASIVGNEFDENGLTPGTYATISAAHYAHLTIIGNTFRANTLDDMSISRVNNLAIGGNVSSSPGRNHILLSNIDGLSIQGGAVRNCNMGSSFGTTAAIQALGITHATITGFSASADSGGNRCTYSIYIGGSSSGTSVSGNSVISQRAGDYNITDSAVTEVLPNEQRFGTLAAGDDLALSGKNATTYGDDITTNTANGLCFQTRRNGQAAFCYNDFGTLLLGGSPLSLTNGLADGAKALKNCGTLTTTASGSDSLSCRWVTTLSACTITPITSVSVPFFYYTATTGSVKVFHDSTAGATYSVACSSY